MRVGGGEGKGNEFEKVAARRFGQNMQLTHSLTLSLTHSLSHSLTVCLCLTRLCVVRDSLPLSVWLAGLHERRPTRERRGTECYFFCPFVFFLFFLPDFRVGLTHSSERNHTYSTTKAGI